ncbi:MAG: hypothetical protein ABEJ42_06050 [Halobacteriaceae archaeon]
MTQFDEADRAIVEHLHESASGGKRYFRARGIAESLGLTAKQVGTRLARLAGETDEVDIEKWGRSRSTTWRVEPA